MWAIIVFKWHVPRCDTHQDMVYLYSCVASHSLSYICYRIFIVMLDILCVTLYVQKNFIIDIGITVGASVGVIYASEFHHRYKIYGFMIESQPTTWGLWELS